MFSYVIVVNDNGTLETVTDSQLENAIGREEVAGAIETGLNDVLDSRVFGKLADPGADIGSAEGFVRAKTLRQPAGSGDDLDV